MSIFVDFPGWFLLLCIGAGLIYSSALYIKDRQTLFWSPVLKVALWFLRFIAVTLLALFLLKPLIKSTERIVEKPIVVIAQDNSSSILLGGDTAFYKSNYPDALNELQLQLSEEFEVFSYEFGAEVEEGLGELDFNDPASDFSKLDEIITSNFSNRNLGAVIIGSDGIYNRGVNPVYAMADLSVPIYTIAMGDTSARKDLVVSEVRNNRLAYLGNRFPIEIQIDAREVAGQKAVLSIKQAGSSLYTEEFEIESDDQQFITSALLDANKTGLQRYTVEIAPLEGEVSLSNNKKEVYIEVLDSRQKILMLAASPHPDLSAIRQALKSADTYEVTVELVEDFDEELQEYDLVILHQLPNGGAKSRSIIQELMDENTPLFFITGKETDRAEFNALSTGIELGQYISGLVPMSGSLNPGFSLFGIDEEFGGYVQKLPPLSTPSSDISISAGAQTLFFRTVGTIETDMPLLSFFQGVGPKIGVLTAEGIWRWRLLSYAESGEHDAFNSIWNKTAQYLSAKKDKRLFRVNGPEEVLETERLIFEAELYNASYESVTDGEVRIQILSEDGNDYPFTFSKGNASYRLDAGQLPIGEYTYLASANRAGKEFKEEGQFVIKPLLLEQTRSQADHNVLFQLAQNSGAKMFMPNETDALFKHLTANSALSSTSYEKNTLSDLIQLKWILFVLLGLLSIEWLLRKRNGSY